MKTPGRRTLALTLTALALVGQAGAGAAHAGHGTASPELERLTRLKGRAFEIAFAHEMIGHHRMAVQMAGAQLNGGKDARLKAAARQIVASQNEEIKRMEGWLKAWNQPVRAASASAHTLTVPRTPAAVDRWFLTEMIPHHEGALEMAKLVPPRSQNAAVRQLATAIVTAQAAEIAQYRSWLKTLK